MATITSNLMFLCAAVLCTFICSIVARVPDNAGTSFVIPAFYTTYDEGVEYDGNPKLYISGLESSASINLTIAGNDEERLTFSVGEGCTIPALMNCRLSAKSIGKTLSAIKIKADSPIAVRMHQEHLSPNMPTSFLSFPTSMLGTDYFVVDPGNVASPTELLITAGEAGARLDFAPSSSVDFDGRNHHKGDVLQINLGAFETLVVRSPGYLTGTEINSDNPVSVIVGDFCSPNMQEGTLCRQPYQLLPSDRWGQRFVMTSFLTSEDSIYQIYASSDDTTVRLLGGGSEVSTVLNRGESSLETARAGSVYVVESDKPIYILHHAENGQALTAISADSQRVTGRTSVPVIADETRNAEARVLITTDCANSEGFLLDLEPLPRSKSVLRSSDGNDCVVSVPIERGNHMVYHDSPDVSYSVTVYVTDDDMSYAYQASLSTESGNSDSNPLQGAGATGVSSFETRPKATSGLLLKWRPPASWPGEPKGYRIQIKSVDDRAFCQCRNVVIHNPRRTSFWLRNLSAGVRYVVGVRPFGSLGSGEATMRIVRRA
ncbi:uncharacterized protein [Diadema setosum]|uniref:uncharacterized protein n=1 Tax=Diadema setosum TaxID=31175 RepID=UPI003B3AF636